MSVEDFVRKPLQKHATETPIIDGIPFRILAHFVEGSPDFQHQFIP
jgi:hypothetical protein